MFSRLFHQKQVKYYKGCNKNMNITIENKKILVTGIAGFIGANLANRLLNETTSTQIIGIDNMSDYYDVEIKKLRLKNIADSRLVFIEGSIADKELIKETFKKYKPEIVVNLAA